MNAYTIKQNIEELFSEAVSDVGVDFVRQRLIDIVEEEAEKRKYDIEETYY